MALQNAQDRPKDGVNGRMNDDDGDEIEHLDESPGAMTDASIRRSGTGHVGDHSRVCLIIQRDANQDQLTTCLSQRYTVNVIDDQSVQDALEQCDLCLIDTASYHTYRDELTSSKQAAEPLFFPFLLLETTRSHSNLDVDVWDVVDDVIETPIRQTELQQRIDVLLRARRYSIDLKRQKDRLEQFADIVSHDLRNPLTIAYGYLDSARETGDDAAFDRVENALKRMQEIIEDVLTLARTGTMIDDVVEIELADVARTAWQTVETRDATLEITLANTVIIRGDETRIIELFENLFRNSVEHAGDNVTIRVGTFTDGFFVEDDGPGIPATERDSVFDYGYSNASDGTGFGLAIVQGIADAHDWTITATSGQPGGARFEITCDVESRSSHSDIARQTPNNYV